MASQYASVGKSYAAQRIFRQDWAKKEYNKLTTERSRTQSQKTSFGTLGRYKPFSIIVRDEGADEEAYKAAVNVVKSCVSMTYSGKLLQGEHPWFKVNTQTKRLEWMHLETSYADLYTDQYDTKETRTTEQESPLKAIEPETPLKGTAGTAVGSGGAGPDPKKRRTGGKAVAFADKGAKPPKPPDDEDTKQLRKVEAAKWNKLAGLREKMRSSQSSATDLRNTIMTNNEWEQFRGELTLMPLDTSTRQLQEFKSTNRFWEAFVVQGEFAKFAKANFSTKEITDNLNMTEDLERCIGNVTAEVSALHCMSAARSKALAAGRAGRR